jgi:predicted amidophosphoribosyltransferase
MALDRCRSAGLYEGALREIIHAFKYGARRSLAKPLARLMRSQAMFEGVDVVVPVPLHRTRKRARGFNQSKDLARALQLDAPALSALRRVRPTRPQTDLPAAQRHRNVRDAFALAGSATTAPHPDPLPARGARELIVRSVSRWRERRSIEGTCVLLVDDVCTTGATLEACARVLKAAGAREVRAVTVARVVWPRGR